MTQKATIKLYIKNKYQPLVKIEVIPDVGDKLEELVLQTLDEIYNKLNSKENRIFRFQNIIFNISEFKYLKIIYK